jgi:hypothetical protein
MAGRGVRRPASLHKRTNETVPDASPTSAGLRRSEAQEAINENKIAREDNGPNRSFWQSRIDEYLSKLNCSEPRLTAETADRAWDRALGRALLPRKVKRQEEEIKKLKQQINTARPARTPAPNDREKKIWEVIQRGAKGLAYCRELERAGVKPRRIKSWKGCPGTYPAAYQVGKPWRHRIQDEKSKIRAKAELSKTRKTLAGE